MELRYCRTIVQFALMLGLQSAPVHSQEYGSAVVSDVLPHIQKNVEALRTLVPDFICDERVTDQNINKGKVTREKVVVSQYRVIRKDSPIPNAFPTFIESREVKTATINDKAKTLSKYEPPIGVEGGFCNDLFVLFDKENEKCFNYILDGSEKLRDRTALILQINTKENVKSIGGRCKVFGPGNKNTAWIDSESMQVMRLQAAPVKYGESRVPLPIFENYFIHRLIDYAKTIIDGSSYWLPVVKHVEFIKAKSQQPGSLWVLDYSNYHMFQVSTKIKYRTD